MLGVSNLRTFKNITAYGSRFGQVGGILLQVRMFDTVLYDFPIVFAGLVPSIMNEFLGQQKQMGKIKDSILTDSRIPPTCPKPGT